MSEARLTIGAEVRCADGACGRLRRIIVHPADGATLLTHLAVGPGGPHEGRLAPTELVATAGDAPGTDILLRCTVAEFDALEADSETAPEYYASWPYPEEGLGARRPFGVEGIERDTGYGNRTTTRDRIPAGGVEIRHGEPVYAVDGEAGRIRALIVELRDRRLTGLLLDGGHARVHLGGRHERIVVPVEAVRTFGDGVQLGLSRDAVHELTHEEAE